MSTNPSPIPPTPLNYAAPVRDDLRTIAVRQRAIMLCILAYIVLFALQFAIPPGVLWMLGIAALAVSVTGAVFVFMLTMAVYNTAAGIVLGIFTLVPLLGLIVLLVVNGRATNILRRNGIKVGLLGANLKQIPTALMPG